jgi:uncharacterized delta-60 repeat protein
MHRFGLAAIVAGALVVTSAPAAIAADGVLDPTFAGGAGFRADQMSLGGTSGSFASSLTLGPGGAPFVPSVAADAAGRGEITIVKFLPDGSGFDTSFNGTGVRRDQVGFGTNPFSSANRVAVAPDGTIVAPGTTGDDGPPIVSDTNVQRYTATGDLFAPFGGGSVRVNLTGGVGTQSSGYSDAVVLSDGSVVAAGDDEETNPPLRFETLVAKYTPTGAIDTTFAPATSGVLHQQLATGTDFSGWKRIIEQPDGKLLLAGEIDGGTNDTVTIVGRLNANGTPDLGFGTNGLVRIQLSTQAPTAITMNNGLALAPDGSIFVGSAVSYFTDPANPPAQPDPEIRFEVGLVKLAPNGTPDPTFGIGGKVLHQFGVGMVSSHADSQVGDIALAPDGKIVIVGQASDPDGKEETLVARFLPDGSLDPSFGTSGAFLHDFADPASPAVRTRPYGVAIASTGAIVIAGNAPDATGKSRTLLARLVGNTAPAAAVAPVTGAQEGTPVTLDASGSTDADGAITGYSWDLNGDGSFGDATGPKASATFTKGPHTVSVQVTDNYGLTTKASQTFTVAALPGIVKSPSGGSVSGTSASLVLTCSAGPDCTGAVLLQSLTGTHATIAKAKHKSHKATSYGRSTFSITAGAQKTIKIHLTAAARKALRHHSSLKAYMLVTTKAGSTSKTTHRTITLHVHRATHKPKHSHTKH